MVSSYSLVGFVSSPPPLPPHHILRARYLFGPFGPRPRSHKETTALQTNIDKRFVLDIVLKLHIIDILLAFLILLGNKRPLVIVMASLGMTS